MPPIQPAIIYIGSILGVVLLICAVAGFIQGLRQNLVLFQSKKEAGAICILAFPPICLLVPGLFPFLWWRNSQVNGNIFGGFLATCGQLLAGFLIAASKIFSLFLRALPLILGAIAVMTAVEGANKKTRKERDGEFFKAAAFGVGAYAAHGYNKKQARIPAVEKPGSAEWLMKKLIRPGGNKP